MHYVGREEELEMKGNRKERASERESERESERDTDILISSKEGWKGLFSHSQISLELSLILAPDNA